MTELEETSEDENVGGYEFSGDNYKPIIIFRFNRSNSIFSLI